MRKYWLFWLLSAALPASASFILPFANTVIACGETGGIPASISCPEASASNFAMVSLLPEPTVTTTANAEVTAVAPPGTVAIAGAEATLTYSFEVVGPPAQAVPVITNIPNVLRPDGSVCVSSDQPGFATARCEGEIITSPGYYFGFAAPIQPVMSGQIVLPFLWLVPNVVNRIDLSAGVQSEARSIGADNPVDQTFPFSLPFPQIDTADFPSFANYQLVVSASPIPEIRSSALTAMGLLVMGIVVFRRKLKRR